MSEEWPDWTGETVVIVASGPSASEAPIEQARGRAKVIVINSSWRLAPWADVLFACDYAWWKVTTDWRDLPARKMTVDRRAHEEFGIQYVHAMKPDDRLYLEPIGTVGWGGNSGFHALNLAVQFGPARIALVGYDMQLKGGLHWHGAHPAGMTNPKAGNVERWRRAVDNAAKVIPAGIEVVNCSAVSALTAYRKVDLGEWL